MICFHKARELSRSLLSGLDAIDSIKAIDIHMHSSDALCFKPALGPDTPIIFGQWVVINKKEIGPRIVIITPNIFSPILLLKIVVSKPEKMTKHTEQ